MSSDMFGAPSVAFGFLLSPEEVRVSEEGDDDIPELDVRPPAKDSNLMFSKPYHMISSDALIDADDDENYGTELSEDAYQKSYWILNFLGILLFANLSLVLPSTYLYILTLMAGGEKEGEEGRCLVEEGEERGVEGVYLIPVGRQPEGCLEWGMLYFGLSISLLSLFQWVGGPLGTIITKLSGERKKPALLVCMLFSILGNGIYAFANGPAMVLVGRSLVGLSASGINFCFSYISITSEKEDRIMRIAVFRVFGMGGLMGAAAMSFLFSYLEPPHSANLTFVAFDAYTAPSYIMAAFSVLACPLIFFGMRECQAIIETNENEGFFFSRAAILNLFYAFFIGFLSAHLEWMIAPLCAYRWNWGVGGISLYFLGNSVLMFPAMVSVKLLKKIDILMRTGDRFFLFISWALMPLGFLLLWLAFQTHYFTSAENLDSYGHSGGLNKVTSYVFLGLGSFVLFTSFTWGTAAQPPTMSSILPPQSRAKMMGLGSVMILLGRLLGPIWGTYALSVMDNQPEMMFGLLTDLVALSLALCLLNWKQLRPGSWSTPLASSGLVLQDAEMEAYSSADDGFGFASGVRDLLS